MRPTSFLALALLALIVVPAAIFSQGAQMEASRGVDRRWNLRTRLVGRDRRQREEAGMTLEPRKVREGWRCVECYNRPGRYLLESCEQSVRRLHG